jgi:hypothetical protein
MPNVRVRFTKPEVVSEAKPTGPIPPPRIDISHEVVRVQSEGFIVWEIESTDPRVKGVKIQAEGMKVGRKKLKPLELFRKSVMKPPNSKTQRVKSLTYVGKKNSPRGYALIWGMAPQVFGKGQRKVHKYGIYGLDGAGNPVVGRDPEIITDPPPIPGVEVPD